MVDKQREEAYLSGIENSFYYPYRAGWQKKSKSIVTDKFNADKQGHPRVDV